MVCFVSGGSTPISTPDSTPYIPLVPLGVNISDVTEICFSVMAKNDVHVALYPGASYTPVPPQLYEIVLGGWSNSKSVLRKSKQGNNEKSVSHHPLSESEFKPFWVRWTNGVEVGTGSLPGTGGFIDYIDDTYNVKYVAIHTGYGATGEWIFGKLSYSTIELKQLAIDLHVRVYAQFLDLSAR